MVNDNKTKLIMELKETKLALYLFLLLGLGLTSCNKDDKTDLPLNSILEKTWTLKSVQNTNSLQILYFPDIPTKLTIEFAENKILNFIGICNSGGGNYDLENNKITITSLITTEVFCSNIEWEEITVQSLPKAKRFELTENKLIIYCEDSYNLVFE